MVTWITERSRWFWLSSAGGVIAALALLPSFTDPWPRNAGGFLFVVVLVTGLVRGAITLGLAFREGWREPRRPAAP